MFALGSVESPAGYEGKTEDMQLAKDLAETCYAMYTKHPSGIAPEIVQFVGNDMRVNDGYEASNFLRPESVESFHILREVTGEAHYVDKAWDVFKRCDHNDVPVES